ncbi:methyl-accepting chemotaxis protein [Rhizobium oryzicola]|uniref:HAMP domain-containing methyl-accepting chemotaxis protein n=1 Tax=Rhizobium oryzicola TaxID=1232668 RepID=A0ABT8SRI9_9HYPH|nr:HAMP domain-containing methyl-accepting chemotaxis protein [Rhizobium oryzicola]MDO1580951.1 HAMP domain-containing methyl-accepting chemotaxis protein [Rhizobium oryzicola]
MRNIPILGKFTAIMLLFGVFATGVAFYAGHSIMTIDDEYSALIDHDSSVALYTARTNRALQASRAAIAELIMARDDKSTELAEKDLKDARESFSKFVDTAIKASGSNPEVVTLKTEGEKLLDSTCSAAIAQGKAARQDAEIAAAQQTYMTTCRAAFNDVAAKVSKVTNATVEASAKRSDELTATSITTSRLTVGGVILGAIAIIALGFFLIRAWLVTPIRGLASTMEVLAGGNLSANVDGTDRRDEVGAMAKAVQVFKDNGLKAKALEAEAESNRNMTEAERARVAASDAKRAAEMAEATSGLAEGLKQLAGGNLGFELSRPFASDFEGLRNDFNLAVSQLRDTLSSVAEATRSIDSGSRELSSSANDLSKRTEQQAASLEETAAALDQITVNVTNASKRTEEARTMAMDANRSAEKSETVVADAVNAMQRIEASSSQISNIIGVIDEIAFQTNLLALNAGVEAARAGEAGKGFAVVAQEVRELAQRSAQAAKEIKDLIRTSADEVENGVRLVSATGDALKMIGGYVVSINGQLDAIATSAREQSVGLSEVNTAVNQMDQTTQQNAAMVEQATAASASLAGEADKLRQLVGRFQIGGGSASGYGHSGPSAASPAHRPVESPVRRMVGKVSKALNLNAAPKAESWEEF